MFIIDGIELFLLILPSETTITIKNIYPSMKKTIVAVLMLLACVLPASAQTGRLFNTDKMLSSSFVGHIYQDNGGFIWVSTRNGLNRYDGYNFKVFRKGMPGCEGMSSNYINTVIQGRDKVLIVGNQRGVQAYYDDSFHNVTLYGSQGEKVVSFVSCFAYLRDSTLLIGTSGNGVFKMVGKDKAVRYEPLKDVQGAKKIMEDSRQGLWVLTERNGVVAMKNGKKRNLLTDNIVRTTLTDICEDNFGRVYISTYDQGVWVKYSKKADFVPVETTVGMHVSALYKCRNGNILLGLDGQGVAIMNPKTHQLTVNPYFSHEIDLSHAKVNTFVEDKAGNIWIGMLQKGVFIQPEKPVGFGYMGYKLGNRNEIGDCCVTSTLIDSRGLTWVGTDGDGVFVLDANHHKIKHIPDPPTVLCLAEDSEGRIWTGSYHRGLGYVNVADFTYTDVKIGSNERLNVFDLEIDRTDNIWIATMGNGLFRYNSKNKTVTNYRADLEATGDRKRNALVNDYISQIDLSQDQSRLYVASTMGLCCLDTHKNSWTSTFGVNVLHYSVNIRSVAETDGNILWYGTDDGLHRRNLTTGSTLQIGESDGLPNGGVASILRDNGKCIWIGTDHGLCQIDATTGKELSCYYVDDGLQGNEFSDGAASLGRNGQLLFGGVGGITWFDANGIHMQKWNATVDITNITVDGKDIVAGGTSGFYTISEKPVMHSDHFDLAYDDNSFSIQLSTLTYDTPEHISYAYSINGDTWTTLQQGQNEINFSHMPPGKYKFRVKAIKNNQESETRDFTIVVHSPWYRSTVAYLFYIAIVYLILRIYFQQRKRKEQDRMRMQEHKHQEELSEAKIKFFMNISHEIRTPMTLIVSPLMTLLKEDHDPQRTGVYTTIKRNAERILHLINQIMDLRKIEKGMMKMRMRETDAIGFVADICNMFEYHAKAKSMTFEFVHEDEKLPVWLDLANFDKVVVNLLSNAFKYTPAGGSIVVTVSHDDKNMTISVCDSGEGIPKDKVDKIFERFYQSDTRTNDRHFGTGIGLDLTHSLVLLHHGTITAKNNEKGGGATFSVTLPLGKAHLREDEILLDAEAEDRSNDIVNLLEESYVEHTDIEEAQEQNVQQRGKRPWAVVVEDDIEIQQYLEKELSSSFKVTTFSNGKDALSAIIKDVPDIVVSDVMMPVMDGNTLCAKLKGNINTNTLPVVLLTAKSRDEDKLEGLETGADAYIVKPFNLEILKRTMLNLIALRNTMRNKMSGNESQEDKVDNLELQTADDKLMERVMKVVNNNIGNPELNVDFIAREVGLSRVHFYRKMKTLTNQSPHNFIRNIRMKQAARLFDAGHQNINDVMYAVGFSNTSTFSTAFKAVYGVSPRDYIKNVNT